MDSSNADSVQLPDELIESIIGNMSTTVARAKSLAWLPQESVDRGRAALLQKGIIRQLSDTKHTSSVVAVDGGRSTERLPDMDLILIQAAGIEGLGGGQQRYEAVDSYASWQAAMPHSESNESLARGIMTLMELIVIARLPHEVRILDGGHLTSIIGAKKLLTISSEAADSRYAEALYDFLSKYGLSIEDIPSVIGNVLTDESIVASTKYNSSRDIVDHILQDLNFEVDDKSLCAKLLRGGEYTTPLRIGGMSQDNEVYEHLHIDYNLQGTEVDRLKFNWLINEAIAPILTQDIHGNKKDSNIYFTYLKPHDGGPVYRLEVKESVALDPTKLEYFLSSIAQQVVFPDIIEPYPQYLADIIAKSVSSGMRAIKEAVTLSADIDEDINSIYSLRNYRT